MTTTTETPDPRVYVASLSDYNNGVLHGVWITLEDGTDAETVGEEVRAMLAASPTAARYGDRAEEAVIHDHEGFGPIRLGEVYPGERVLELAATIREHGPAFAAWYSYDESRDPAEFADAYHGEWESGAAYAEEFANDTGGVDETFPYYGAIDWEHVWHGHFECGGWRAVPTGAPSYGVWIFAP